MAQPMHDCCRSSCCDCARRGCAPGERQSRRVSLAERERTVVVHGLGEALLSFLEHFGVDVEHGDARVPVSVLGAGVIEDAHRNVAGSACDVEALEPALGVEFRDVVVLPEPVDAKGHGVVHDIVRGRDRREHAADWQRGRSRGSGRQAHGGASGTGVAYRGFPFRVLGHPCSQSEWSSCCCWCSELVADRAVESAECERGARPKRTARRVIACCSLRVLLFSQTS